MSRKFILAIAAVAALGMSTLAATDAFARGGGGGGGGHGGGGHSFGGHASGFSRGAFHGRTTMTRNVSRTHGRTVGRTTHPTKNKYAGRKFDRHPRHPTRIHYARHHHHWWWCRHHAYRCGGTWVDVGVEGGVDPVPVATVAPVAATPAPAAAVCTNDCDYFLNDEPGCYMAKRSFSTPAGDELRCVKICEEPAGKRAEK